MNEEGANLCSFRRRIEVAGIPRGVLVAAKEGPALAPTTAADQLAVALSNKISTIVNQVGVDAKDGGNRRFDLLLGIVCATLNLGLIQR